MNWVEPLFKRDTPFDIALTIFARIPQDKCNMKQALVEETKERQRLGDFLPAIKKLVGAAWPESQLLTQSQEVVLFEDIVLRNMSIAKGRRMGSVDIDFELPLERL